MIIPIKQALLEGYSLEAIVEAVHTNHPNLNKRRLKDPATSYIEGKEIEQNRKKLADDIKELRGYRDRARKNATTWKESNPEASRKKTKDANEWDNDARTKSQNGGERGFPKAKELKPLSNSKALRIMQNVPRIISSAKK